MLDMSHKGVSAFAVVSSTGKLIGNFSTSELRWVADIQGRKPDCISLSCKLHQHGAIAKLVAGLATCGKPT